MPPAKQLSTEPVTKRIHVGGLAASVTAKDLVQRFSSFGTVLGGEQAVEGLGKHDNGLPRSFAFFNLETTEAKFARCMSMLNGSMWKAHKLRIAPAKADWQARRSTERTEAAAVEANPPRPKKRKRSKDPNVGMMASQFELVTQDNLKRHRGWVLDSKPAPAPLFPLLVRPPHPIELPAKPAATAWTRGKAKAKPSKAAREALRLGIPLEKPSLQRAKRMRIDPRRWGRQKVIFDGSKENEAVNMLAVGTWECEAVEHAEGEAEPVATWVFKGRDGTVKMRETVRLSQQSAYTDRFTALLERMNRPTTALQPAKPAPLPTVFSPAYSSGADSDATSDSDSESNSPVRKTRPRSTSPPPYIPAAPRNLIYNEEDAFQLMAAALGAEERDAAHALERSELVKLAAGVVEEVGATPPPELPVAGVARLPDGRPLPKVEGFADDDDDDSDLFPAMRLRGGAGVSSDSSSDEDDSSSDDESSSSSDSDSDSESSSEGSSRTEKQISEEDAKMEDAPAAVKEAPKTSLVKDSLKSMFKPQEETGGFSLLSGLDLDLDPVERTPSPEPTPIPISLPPQRSFAPALSFRQPRAQQPVPSGPSLPFFALPSGEYEDRVTGEVVVEEVEKLGLSAVAVERARAESKQRFEDAAMDFWRSESMEQIEEDHQKLRETLRGHARKRHREAAKRSKRKAGRRAGGVALDIVDDE
ncbi:hypothetical protein JCM11251_003326 [Rhodosporidiobolus azoricus]